MAESFELNAELRHEQGKGASRRLRRLANKVPGIMYGGEDQPQMLTFDHLQLLRALENEAFATQIITLHIGDKKQMAVLKALQRHPYKPRIQHLDFLRITGKEKIHMTVPLHFSGGDAAPGVKIGNGVVSHLLSAVEIRCLPSDLPRSIAVDLSKLELNQSLHLSDLQLPKGVELVALLQGVDQERNLPVASVQIPRAAATVDETAAPVASEVPASQQTAPEKGAEKAPEKKADKK